MELEAQKLYRNTQKGVLAGVCAGLADYFKVDTVWVRLIFMLSVFFGLAKIGFIGPIVYIVLWIILPLKPYLLFPKDIHDVSLEPHFPEPPEIESRVQHGILQEPKKPILGIVLLGVGILLLLIQLDYFNFWNILRYWPVILISIGITVIISSFHKDERAEKITDDVELNENENEI